MPSRRQARNINYGIEQTASNAPGRFWAFNNGVTALVNEISTNDLSQTLIVSGIAIVNGAQTTGALGRVDESTLDEARVMIRFVEASSTTLVEQIIRFNNSQNPIQPSDFRSSDPHQERLRAEFKKIPDVAYLGARRGGQEDRARRPSNLIPSDTAAQALAAFHQDPATAYHDLRNIWERDEVYVRYFGDHTTAGHIVFCYSLWRTVAEAKADLRALSDDQQTSYQREALDYLQRRGSLHLLVAAIGGAVEVYLDRPVNDSFGLSFGTDVSPAEATTYWSPVVEALLPFAAGQLGPVFENGGLRRKETVSSAINAFRAVTLSTKRANASVFDEFSRRLTTM